MTALNMEYAIDNKENLVRYLYNKLDVPTNLRIQKTLYLLWAFYAGTYGSLDKFDNEDEELELNAEDYPKELFKPAFEAWRYGPVDNDIYSEIKSDEFEKGNDFSIDRVLSEKIKETPSVANNISIFLDNLISQFNGIDDWSLVARTHQDKSWSSKYVEGQNHIPMDQVMIREEYFQKLKN